MKNFMRFLALLSLLAAFLTFSNQSAGAATELEDRWLNDAPGYERALQLQRELGVPLVVYFYTDWCPFCHSLERDYLPTPPVRQYLKGVVKVRINPEHGPQERVLSGQYGVTGFPAFFVMRKPSSLPTNVNPFRTTGGNLTPVQFVRACERGVAASGLVSAIGISIKPVPLAGAAAVPKVASPSTPSITSADQPNVNTIINRYVQAVGGKTAVAAVTSRVTKGRIDIPGVSFGGRLETYAKAPNMSLTVMSAEPIGVLKRGFDGRTAWVVSDEQGTHLPSPKELASLAAEDNLYRDIKLQELYSRISLFGKDTLGSREVYVLEAMSRFGVQDKLYFDVGSGLLLRRDTMRPSSQGPVRTEIYFSDWRDVDGIKLPFKTTERMPDRTYVFTLEEVKHNVQLDDEVFRVPSR
jgi:outer membrane lipoprotein-sorting protein/thiol-disulfide isomerase/thioredoxin